MLEAGAVGGVGAAAYMGSLLLAMAMMVGSVFSRLEGRRTLLLPVVVMIGSTLKVCWDKIFQYIKQELDAARCPGSEVSSTDWVGTVSRMSECRSRSWLAQPPGQIFLKAYELVTLDASGWFWSQILLALVTPLLLHLHVNRASFKRWERLAFTGVGLLGAICSAFSAALLLLNVLNARNKHLRVKKDESNKVEQDVEVSSAAIASGFLSLLCVFFLPRTVSSSKNAFAFFLIFLHLSLCAPCVEASSWKPMVDSKGFSRRKLFFAVGICSALLHLEALLSGLYGRNVSSLITAALSNPCQISIFADAMLSTGFVVLYMLSTSGARAFKYIALAPLLGPGAMFSFHLRGEPF